MSEQPPRPTLDEVIEDKFRGVSDTELIRRIERAPDFGWDDEGYELNRRLKLANLAFRWSVDLFHPRIEVYKPEESE